MKRKILFFVLILSLAFTSLVYAIDLRINDVNVKFNDNSGYPYIDAQNRTQVPLRVTMEAFGAKIEWDKENLTAIVTKDGITVKVPVGKAYIYKNDIKIDNDTAAQIKDNRTYLPIRVVLEAFGAEVGWEKNNTVLVTIGDTNRFYSDTYAVASNDIMISPKEVHYTGNSLIAEMYVYNGKDTDISNIKDIDIKIKNKEVKIASGHFDYMIEAVIPPKSYVIWTFEFGHDSVLTNNADLSFLETTFSASFDY